VRFAVESALLQGLAAAQGTSLAGVLAPSLRGSSDGSNDGSSSGGSNGSSSGSSAGVSVCVNGLLPGSGSVSEVVSAAEALVASGCSVIKVKVGRRQDPAEDAAVIVALHRAFSSSSSSGGGSSDGGDEGVILTADANRAWTLQQALCFATALQGGLRNPDDVTGSRHSDSSSSSSSSRHVSCLAYIEEPTQDPRDMPTFYAETGIAVAVDESLDEGLVGPQRILLNPAADSAGLSTTSSSSSDRLDLSSSSGLSAVVVKPAVVGGIEKAWGLVRWAQQQGIRAVISSSFESSVGLAALHQLAAAVDASSSSSRSHDDGSSTGGSSSDVMSNGLWAGFGGSGLPSGSTPPASAAAAAAAGSANGAAPHSTDCSTQQQRQQRQQQCWHGLGTLSWFASDTVPASASLQQYASAVPAAASWRLLQDAAGSLTAATAADGVNHSSSSSSSSNGKTTSSGGTSSGSTVEEVVSSVLQVQYNVLSAAGTAMVVTGSLALPNSSSSTTTTNISSSSSKLPVVLLHGFMGSATDWHPLMSALAVAGHPCLAINLPGHGSTGPVAAAAAAADCYSLETAAAVAAQAAAAAFGPGTPCLLVGYSMGARVALQSVLGKGAGQHYHQQQQQQGGSVTTTSSSSSSSSSSRIGVTWAGAVIISGTPGIPDPDLRAARVLKDQELADLLQGLGAAAFLNWWYSQPLWASLRAHPGFSRLLLKRAAEQQGQEQQLAASLKYSSTGRMVGSLGGCGVCGGKGGGFCGCGGSVCAFRAAGWCAKHTGYDS
jgi:isochorismate synthase/2-succinyl-5-enolpyruvyl-6-hydroxy-3-cyclohexene-1-carboxylate synthase/2-succinyl-6-hydroxy-2,4-cyclohexadiene-1-carboxylate synthase/O-succinylbenzoate synthase